MCEEDSLEKSELETQYQGLPSDRIQQWKPRAENHLLPCHSDSAAPKTAET